MSLILLECEQGSEAWQQARLGIPTASQFDRIITTSGAQSKQANGYMAELIAEHITGQPVNSFTSDDMRRGTELEPVARARYELESDNNVTEVGGVFLDETKKIMASPDGLIPEIKRGLEIKCPKLSTHIKYVLENELPNQYVLQVQGGMWITGYKTWDFVSFCPEYTPMPILIITVKRDENLIKEMDKNIRKFSEKLELIKGEK
ncbi:MAG: YqaJ viral recombinase family protein [Cardiobacteriaceae bacterium]|nr:YqaJ viral recombinase family protein [Cardiobacteriaceae bacterium]